MMWVYVRSEPGLWTVGFYTPDGQWTTDSDWDTQDAARERVHYLNGGSAQREAQDANAALREVQELAEKGIK